MNGRKRPVIFYGWVVAAVSAITVAVVMGLRFSFAVFYVAILDEFGWSRASAAFIFSLHVAVYGLMAPLAGALSDRFGPRKVIPFGIIVSVLSVAGCSLASSIWHFYLLFGFLAAIGLSVAGIIPHQACLSNWFIRKRAGAFGMLHAGMGVAALWVLSAQSLISSVGWRAAYVIVAATVAVIALPLVCVFQRHRPEDIGLLPDGIAESSDKTQDAVAQERRESLVVDEKWVSTEWTLSRAIRTYRLWALLLALFFWFGIAMQLTMAHEVAFLVDVGFTSTFAALIVSIAGLVNAGTCLAGSISDRLGREKTVTMGCTMFMLAVLMLLLVKDTPFPWILYFFVLFWGMGTGIVIPALMATEADLFQGRHFGAIMGTIATGSALGAILGPWLGGKIYDVTGSYYLAWIIVMAAIGVSCLLTWVASPRRIRLVAGATPSHHGTHTSSA